MSRQSKKDRESQDPLATSLFSLDVEKSVLGAILLEPEKLFYEAAAAGLVCEHFHLSSNEAIYRGMLDLVDSGVPIDMVTLCNYLGSLNSEHQMGSLLDSVGGVAYVSSLIDGIPDRPSIGHYIDILKEKYLRRQARILGERLMAMAEDPADSIQFALSGAHEDVLKLQGDAQEKTIAPLAEITGTVLGNIERMMSFSPDQTIGIPFGMAELDEVTTGMRKGHLVVVGAFPKAGKTSFAIDVARKVAKGGKAVGIFSREMLQDELVERMLTQESDVSYLKIRKPMNLMISEFRLLERTKADMDKWPIVIDDKATHISEMIPRAHLMIRKHKAELLIFDYIQILEAPGEKEYERVSYVANTLQSLAKSTGVPVMALSQLTNPEGRKGDLNTMPNMGMLRASGQIQQNANLILLLYHPVEKETGSPSGEDLIIVGAQRAGPTGRIKAWFNLPNQRWEPRGQKPEEPKQETIFAGQEGQ